MKSSVYKSYDELPLFLNSDLVAKTLGIAPSSAYELMHKKRFSHSVYRQPYGRSERKVHPVGGGAHEGRCHYMRRTKTSRWDGSM